MSKFQTNCRMQVIRTLYAHIFKWLSCRDIEEVAVSTRTASQIGPWHKKQAPNTAAAAIKMIMRWASTPWNGKTHARHSGPILISIHSFLINIIRHGLIRAFFQAVGCKFPKCWKYRQRRRISRRTKQGPSEKLSRNNNVADWVSVRVQLRPEPPSKP